MTNMPTNADPAPIAPPRPEIDDCCRSGCDPCIFDLYEDAMERYRVQLLAWEAGRTSTVVKKVKHGDKKAVPVLKNSAKSNPKK